MLRKLHRNDLNELSDRLNNLSKEDKDFFHPHGFEINDLEKLLTLDYDHYFVFEKDNRVVGYSMLRTFGKYKIPTFGGIIWKDFRGKGYGSELLIETLFLAKEIGFDKVKLKVYKNNEVAFNLYKKHDFQVIGEEGKQFWMEKNIS
jgi:ribosomal protein S18 acetylase RimI-like enzyme